MDKKKRVCITVRQIERIEGLRIAIEDAKTHLTRLESDLEDHYFTDICSYLDCVRDMLDFDWNELSDVLVQNSKSFGEQF
jgi:hypothetical protein